MVLVSYVLIIFSLTKNTRKKIRENHELEILWTFLPGIILILIAIPSLRLLYLSEEREKNPLILKTIGHQWYWSYEYSDFGTLDFDSFIKTEITTGISRLLETDNNVVIPSKTPIQVLISSTDVLHAWTIPALGVKADSVPGRLNVVNLIRLKSGLFFGQCSEICGTNHRFIPITLDVRPINYFKLWISSHLFLES